MSDLRKDPITGRWVIIASNRGQRPQEFQKTFQLQRSETCPFCPGQECQTPPEVRAIRDPETRPDQPGWRVRVVPNRYPALHPQGDGTLLRDGVFEWGPGCGVHEVIIETPRHGASVALQSVDDLRDVLTIYQERLLVHRNDTRLAYGLIFKNSGPQAGASLEHSHAQFIATPFIPTVVAEELQGAHAYYRREQSCIFCDLVEQERQAQLRVVLESSGFVAFCPFASRFPFETWVTPRRHVSHFEDSSPSDLGELADVLKTVLGKIESSVSEGSYNYVLHTAPWREAAGPDYHWHLEILPRSTGIAGFELGAGAYMNPLAPESAARLLRDVELPG
ncbi:MAG: galactose-1-phosphate uridylyltransferase [Planctomycetes bacterium]|nr:galactose-1-phosphate uridylyltransferase [Planctomycetota bacterium]